MFLRALLWSIADIQRFHGEATADDGVGTGTDFWSS